MKAVVFIDVQNDFVSGSLGSKWAEEVAPKIIEFANECRDNGYIMLATKDTHYEDYKETLEGKLLPVTHCYKYEFGSQWGWQLVDGLALTKDNKVNIIKGNIIEKPTFGSFALLDRFQKLFENVDSIRTHNIDHFQLTSSPRFGMINEPLEEIIICGFVTSICVISNALMLRAKYPNVKITLRSDLCADINEESHQAALTVMKNCQINVI